MTNRIVLSLILAFTFLSAQAQEPEAQLIRGPYLQVGTPTSMMIRWRTDVLTRGLVRYGTDPMKLNKQTLEASLQTDHKVKLDSLSPNTRYYYSVGSFSDTLKAGPDNYFVTLPPVGTEALYRVAAVGDCGNNSVNQRAVRDQLIKYIGDNYLNAWILLGDNAYGKGRDAEFQTNFFSIYKNNLLAKYPLYPAPGNHDYSDEDTTQNAQKTHKMAYYQNFSMPTEGEAGGVPSHNPAFYSFDLGNIHFLSLDSYGEEENQYRLYDTLGPQVTWIKKDLEANQNRGWVIAYWHHPPYTMGSHNSDKTDELTHIRENFIRILERYGVDLIICGHSHDYERSRLMQGHYGMQNTFDSTLYLISHSSGRYDGSPNSCPYTKDSVTGYKGTIYVVSGSAGQLGGMQKTYPHTALPYSDAIHGGASMLEIQGNRLDLKWVCADGAVRDQFTIMKNVNQHQTVPAKKNEPVTLTASFVSEYQWSNGATTKTISLTPDATQTYTVKDKLGCLEDTFKVEVTK